VFNQYYAPAVESTGQLLTQLCEALAVDYEVTVVTGLTEGASSGRQQVNGVDVVRVPSTTYARRRLSLRALNYLTYAASSFWMGLTASPPSLVISMTDPPFVPAFAALVARRFRVPYLVIVQDVFPEIAVELGRLTNPVVVRALDLVVSFGVTRAESVSAIGETMKRRLVEKGIASNKITVIPNWVDSVQLMPAPKDNDWSRAHDLHDKFVVMHSGNVGYAQDLEQLIRAATFVRDLEQLRFVIIGGGAKKGELIDLADRLDADNVIFLPYQEPAELRFSLSAADVHFVGLARGLSGFVVPSRLNGVMSVARPVIVGADPESEIVSVVERSGSGVPIPPGRPELLAAAIRDAYEGRVDLGAMGRRGRNYVEHELDRSVSMRSYSDLVARLTATG